VLGIRWVGRRVARVPAIPCGASFTPIALYLSRHLKIEVRACPAASSERTTIGSHNVLESTSDFPVDVSIQNYTSRCLPIPCRHRFDLLSLHHAIGTPKHMFSISFFPKADLHFLQVLLHCTTFHSISPSNVPPLPPKCQPSSDRPLFSPH
jgi:hypothetical protein